MQSAKEGSRILCRVLPRWMGLLSVTLTLLSACTAPSALPADGFAAATTASQEATPAGEEKAGATPPNASDHAVAGDGIKLFREPANETQALLDDLGSPQEDPAVVRQRLVKFNPDALASAGILAEGGQAPEPLEASLFHDTLLSIEGSKIVGGLSDQYGWTGAVTGEPNSSVSFVVDDEALTGNIRLNDKLYQISPAPEGLTLITEIDLSEIPDEGDDVGPGDDQSQNEIKDWALYEEAEPSAEPGFLIGLMILYTDDAKEVRALATGVADQIESDIIAAIVEANETYRNSGIDQRLYPVYIGEVSYEETGDGATDVTAIKEPSDGVLDFVHDELLVKYPADLTLLVTKTGASGRAYAIMSTVSTQFNSQAYAVSQIFNVRTQLTLPHELGHLMGARHDWYADAENESPYSHNHGYTKIGDWRTVMAYEQQCSDAGSTCSRIAVWANPDLLIDQDPTGIPRGTSTRCDRHDPSNPACDADMALTLNKTALVVARFRGLGENEAGDLMGHALASGDFNGDGYVDLAIGGPGETTRNTQNAGWVHVFKGTPYGLGSWMSIGRPSMAMDENDRFGFTLAAGDFDGDGNDDLAVGAPGAGSGEAESAGTVFTYRGSGSDGLQPWTTIAAPSAGEGEDEGFGTALATGDFDGDGNDDVAVGAPGESTGSVFTYRGAGSEGLQSWTTISPASATEGEDERFGTALAAGDFDGDGNDDLAVGAPGESPGNVFTYRVEGSEGLRYWTTIAPSSTGDDEDDRFGSALASGDFDGDGRDDLAVGAPGVSPGTVFTYRGNDTEGLLPWTDLSPPSVGVDQDDRFGFALAAGDFDGDGNDDLAAGAPGATSGDGNRSGLVYTYRGSRDEGLQSWSDTGQSWLGVDEEDDRFGFALVAGDFDGDGNDDMAVGAPGESPGEGEQSGYVFTFRGADGALMAWRGLHQER